MPRPSRDITGTVCGRLTVLHPDGANGYQKLWLCQCECGNRVRVRGGDLNRKDGRRPKSCGCARKDAVGSKSPGWTGHGEISGKYWRHVMASARSRGLAFSLTIEYAWDLFAAQARRCALTGWELTMGVDASLDRVVARDGYVPGNVQWLHKEINQLKSNRNDAELVALCRAVVSWSEGKS